MSVVFGFLVLLGIVLLVVIVTAFGIGAIARSRKRGTSGSLSAAALNIQAMLLDDQKKHMIESMRAEREDEEQTSGDPPER